jgi:hypothetical protein
MRADLLERWDMRHIGTDVRLLLPKIVVSQSIAKRESNSAYKGQKKKSKQNRKSNTMENSRVDSRVQHHS